MDMMKKRRLRAGLALIAMLALLSGCGSGSGKTAEDKKEETAAAEEEKTKTEAKTDTGKKDEKNDGLTSGNGSAAAPEQEKGEGAEFYLYHPDSDFNKLEKEKAEVEELSPENVLGVLAEKGIVPEDIRINSLQETEKDGEKALDVDFSSEFAEYLGGQGSTGEYLTMGSVCNTFLDAYGCKKIHITVDGGVLTTGHNEYPGYLGFHE